MTYAMHFTYCTYITVLYDGEFESKLGGFNMDDAMEYVTSCMKKHNFKHADITDSDTGEVIMTIEARD